MDVLEGTRGRARGLFWFSLVAGILALTLALSGAPAQAQSTTSLSVAYGCDQFAVYVAASDSTVASWLNTSGGYGYLQSRFFIRRAPTWLSCELSLASKNGGPIQACDVTVEVAGTDAQITGWQITRRYCHA